MPKKKIMTSLMIREVSGVDVPAQQGARVLLMKRGSLSSLGPTPETFTKSLTFMTSVTNGHAHLLSLADGTSGMTWCAGPPGEPGHCHPWILNSEGVIVVGEVEGHAHDVDMDEVRAVLDRMLAKADRAETALDVLGQPDELPDALRSLTDDDVAIAGEELTAEQEREQRERNAQVRDAQEREARTAMASEPKTLLDLDLELERMAREARLDGETMQQAFVRLVDSPAEYPDFHETLAERDRVARTGATLQ